MRGIRVFQELTSENTQIERNVVIGTKLKGRCNHLFRERNNCLVSRYFYYAKLKRLNYDDVLKNLKTEFFITERTIINTIQDEHDFLKKIIAEKPSVNELKRRYQFLIWEKII